MAKNTSKKGKNRQRMMSRYDQIYRRIDPFDGRCVYCGQRASTVDHVPPLESVYGMGSDWYVKRGVRFIKVPACGECNSLLGSRPLETVRERQVFIERQLDKRYEELLTRPKWRLDELEETKGGLQQYLVDQEAKRHWIESRMEWARLKQEVAA